MDMSRRSIDAASVAAAIIRAVVVALFSSTAILPVVQAALPDAHNQFRHFEPRPSIVNGNNNTSTSSSPPVGVIPIQQLNNNRNGSAFNSLSNVTVPTTTIALPLRQFAGANITAINETTTAANSIRTLPPYLRRKCRDTDMNCFVWVAKEQSKCDEDEYFKKHCQRSCNNCGSQSDPIEERYNMRRVPPSLQHIAFLIGRWRSDFGGKADFPTIPRFTYGEEIDFGIATVNGKSVLNYTAFAWDNSDPTDKTELHSENGFIAGEQNGSRVALNTVMSNGFVTIEEGEESEYQIRLLMQRIGRINFSRDLPVRKMIREWTLLDARHLEARLIMGTVTHRMLLHTQITYERIHPR